MLLASCIAYALILHAQAKLINGKVTDQQGQPVPFATIRVKNSKQGVSADADGNFSIRTSPAETLVVSGANITEKEVAVGDSTYLNIQVAHTTSNLNEVVVTALGIRRSRNSLPYAAQQISGDEINKVPTVNAIDNLSGKVAGLEITSSNTMGGSTNAILRGMKSLTQTNQALFIVDGVPYDNTNQSTYGYDLGNAAADINPDDIATISVLKGAAASALYGSRASNGVILITTKKGSNRKAMSITASFGVTAGSFDKSTLPTYQTQYGEGYGSIGGNDNNGNNPNPFFYYQPIPSSGGQPVPIVVTNIDAATGPAYDPAMKVYNWDAFSPTNPNYGKATPWQPAAHHDPTDFFVTPVITSESVIAEGGGEQGTFKLGYTRNDDKGMMPNSSIFKNMVDLDATYNLTDRLTAEGSLDYVNENAINRNLYQYTGTTNPMTDFRQWWPTNVDLQELKHDYFNSLTNATWNWQDNGSYQTNALGNIGKPAYHNNPYFQQYQNFESDGRDRYLGYAKLNYKVSGFLNVMGRVSKDYYDQQTELRTNVGSVELPFYSRFNQSYDETNYDLLINFDKNLNTDFNLKALLGGNVRQDNIQDITAATNGGLIIPGLWSLSNTVQAINAPAEQVLRKEVDGIFAGATLAFREMLTLDATIRRDKSSTLPAANNTYYYPSVSANFIFSKLVTPPWLSYGKVWANYAEVGGDAPYYSVRNTYTLNTPLNGEPVMAYSTVNNNANLLPEKNNTYEAGLEMAFLHNRIGFNADYYHSRQIDQIMPISVSTSSGYFTYYVNGGTVQNQGVELNVNITPVKTNAFSWTLTLNWSMNRNKILFLYGNQPSFVLPGGTLQNSIQIVAEAGKPYGIIRGTDYVYKNGQRVVDSTGHYEISSNRESDIGNINPNWIGGVNNSLTYKNLTLSFLIDMKQGGQLYSLDMDYGSSSGLYPRTAGFNDKGKPVRAPLSQGGGIILNAVTADGKPNTTRIDESDILAGDYSFSSAYGEADKEFIYDASYIKLREAALTYSVPAKAFGAGQFIKGLDVSVSGRNLWIIHKNLPYADPEQGQASGNVSIGFQNGAYPTVRTFATTLKFRF